MKVLVTHPGIQHSHQLAIALHARQRLGGFWSGVPVYDKSSNDEGIWAHFASRLRDVPIPPHLRRHPAAFPLVNRLTYRLFRHSPFAVKMDDWLNSRFDLWVAHRLKAVHADIVVCYETAALATFTEAKKLGATTVLDAASLHFLASDGESKDQRIRKINQIKRQELQLADFVITCSPLAAQSYVDGGVARARVFAVPLGANNACRLRANVRRFGPCRFLFVGSIRVLKGVDLLLDAFQQIMDEGSSSTLTLVGDCADTTLRNRIDSMIGVQYLGRRSSKGVSETMALHDCLVMPSRHDGFGMVVAEALAVGLPVIVSDRAGASCVLADEPAAGILVSCDVDAIAAAMRRFACDRDVLQLASAAALRAASKYSWDAYGQRINDVFDEISVRMATLQLTQISPVRR